MEKDFDAWNKIKKRIDISNESVSLYPKEGQVWMICLGRNIGFEQNGIGQSFSRPVLIIKKFNNNMFWCVPLSTKQKKLDFYFNYTDPVNYKVSAILAQMKLASVKRFKRKLYDLDLVTFEVIKTKLKSFL
jgi:mRNA interferase MazF